MSGQERETLKRVEGMASDCGGLSWSKAIERLIAIRKEVHVALAAREEPPTIDPREFCLWADHTWTGVGEESDEIENASLNVVPKAVREGEDTERPDGDKEITFEVIQGPEGACLAVGTGASLTRIVGPKPWGGGTTVHKFKITLSTLMEELHR